GKKAVSGWMGFLTISNQPREEIISPDIQSRAVLIKGNYPLSIIHYPLSINELTLPQKCCKDFF
ncbi:hypothetical protein, partial [Okeania sp. SIO3B5]|uniref:hypothetical protein n=1 Tax=Okeania sp. SIO3B5 TaxID=2607811 RepID=UPI0025F64825